MIFTPLINPVPIGADVHTVTESETPHLVLVFQLGIPFPVGENQIGIIPFGEIAIPMPKEDGEKYAKKILEEAEKLPKSSQIIKASSMIEAEQLASQFKQFGGGN